jgi:hypothetical protein
MADHQLNHNQPQYEIVVGGTTLTIVDEKKVE